MTEAEFLAQIVELATYLGWTWKHDRPARTAHGWRTPTSGPLGKGWPDLTLVRARDGRMVLAELKRDDAPDPAGDQAVVLAYLREAATAVARWHGWLTVAVWRPRDFDVIVEILT